MFYIPFDHGVRGHLIIVANGYFLLNIFQLFVQDVLLFLELNHKFIAAYHYALFLCSFGEFCKTFVECL